MVDVNKKEFDKLTQGCEWSSMPGTRGIVTHRAFKAGRLVGQCHETRGPAIYEIESRVIGDNLFN